jgi:glycosyltransferase involved in cell wall biosynthesis
VRNFDLVYLSAIWQWLGIVTAPICARQQVPLVVGTRGSFDRVLRERHRWRKTLYWHLFLKKSLARAAALHFTTEYERRESRDLLAKFTSFIVVNGIDCNYFHPVKESRDHFRKQYGIPLDSPVVITVGRADPKKRVDLLIRALHMTPELHLLVVGPDSYNLIDTWKGLAQELGIQDRIFWTGHLQGEALLSAYSAADLFSLISTDENFANVVVEAMACGLPILLNPEVGIWEEVKNAGVGIAVEQNSESIAGGFRDFVNNPGRWASYGKNSVPVARELFSHDKVAAFMAMAFQDVLAGTRSMSCRWQFPSE